MVITPETVQDWQSIDSRVAENVRNVEHQILLDIFGVRTDFYNAFTGGIIGGISPRRLAKDLEKEIHKRSSLAPVTGSAPGLETHERARIRELLGGEFQEIIHRERMRPAGDELERRQRITRELAAAVRRSVPAHLIDRLHREPLPETPWTGVTITRRGITHTVSIDLTHEFWHNRIQSPEELIDSIAGREIGAMGMNVQPPLTPPNDRLTRDEAEDVVSSTAGGTGTLGTRLLQERVRTLVSDQAVHAANVATVIHLARNHAAVRRVLIPDLAKVRRELNEAQQERTIVNAIKRLRAIDFSTVDRAWGPVGTADTVQELIQRARTERGTLSGLAPGAAYALTVIGAAGTLPANPTAAESTKASLKHDLEDRLKAFEKQDAVYANYASQLAAVIGDIRAVEGRRGSAPTTASSMFAGLVPTPAQFTQMNSPDAIANDIEQKLQLATVEGAYDQKVKEKAEELRDLEEGKKLKTGKEAVLEAYRAYFQELRGKGWRLTEDAARTLYERNNAGHEEEQARAEAQEEIIGRDQRFLESTTNPIHNFLHGRPEVIVAALAEAEGIGAPTNGTRQFGFLWRKHRNQRRLTTLGLFPATQSPKWSALNNPKLLTAYYALRKLRQDDKHTLHLRNTAYYRKQMDEISDLLVRRLGEKSERDVAKELEIPGEELERKAMGEPDKKQRGIRLLLSGDILASYTGRVDKAIEEANGRVRFIKRNVANAARATGRAVVRQWGGVKNVASGFIGKSTNPLFNYTLGLPYQVAVRAPVTGFKKLWGGLRAFHSWGRSGR